MFENKDLEKPLTKRVLIVDAKPYVANAFRFVLQTVPFTTVIDTATNRAQIQQVCKSTLPDIVLLDLELEHENIEAIVQDIHHFASGARIIAFARLATNPQIIQQALLMGVADCLSKDCSYTEILAAMFDEIVT